MGEKRSYSARGDKESRKGEKKIVVEAMKEESKF